MTLGYNIVTEGWAGATFVFDCFATKQDLHTMGFELDLC